MYYYLTGASKEQMRLTGIQIENFRCFNQISVPLKSRVNLLIGNNGSGKSAVLDAIAVGLGAVLTHLPDCSGISFKLKDIRQLNNRFLPYAKVDLQSNNGVEWDRTIRRDKSRETIKLVPPSKGIKELIYFLDIDIIDKYNNENDFILPVFAYYGVSRAILDIPLRRRGFKKAVNRFSALAKSLEAVSRFKSAFIWFYNKENEENRLQKEKKSFDETLKELDVVRKAIQTMFPDLHDPHIEVNPLRFMIKKDSESLSIDQLSDGYKTMFGLIIDLSSRLAMANPGLENPLEGEAIVMIDEVDLHLHPKWQKRIVGDLIKTFPNTQFILTTHSPYLIESLNNHLKRDKIKSMKLDQEIEVIIPLDKEEVSAYLLEDNAVTSLMDKDAGLIDDRFLEDFNDINRIYDKMRDIEWDKEKDD